MALFIANQIQRSLSRTSLCSISRSSSACSCRGSRQTYTELATNKECWSRKKHMFQPLHRRSHSNPPSLRYPFEYDSTIKNNQAKRYFTRYEREEREEEEEAQEEDIEGELEHEVEDEINIPKADFSAIREEFLAKSDVTRDAYDTANELNLQAESKYQKAMSERIVESDGTQYRLESARPRQTSEEEIEEGNEGLAYDVFEHYTMLHERRETTVLPHLQPNMLRPFGATDTLIFPTSKPKRPKIKYPIYNTYEASPDMHGSEVPEDSAKSTSQQREYSTLRKTESLPNNAKQNKAVAVERGKVNIVNKQQSSQFLSAKHLNKPLLPTDGIDKCIKTSKTKINPSKEAEKYNSIISEFKKVNPDAKLKKRELTSGSDEEKKALDKAIKFASEYREKFNPEAIVKKVELEQTKLPENLTWKENFDMLNKKSTKMMNHDNRATLCHESSVESTSVKQVKLKPVQKLNVLQTSALPGETDFLDKAILEDNEKLTPPWPAYSETVKGKPSRGSNFLIKYPSGNSSPEMLSPEAHIRRFGTFSGRQRGTKRTPHIGTTNQRTCYQMPSSYYSLWRLYCTPSSRHPLGREGTVMPKTRRLPKIKIKQPKRVCPAKKELCEESERADYYLKVKPKKLPKLKAKSCPCREDPPLSKGSPLKRPKKTHEVPEIKVVCPTEAEKCGRRADDGIELVKPKKLPKMVPRDCPCSTDQLEDAPPLKRLIPREVKIPKRICKAVLAPICPPRADGKIIVKRKQLPILRAPDCPCVEDTPATDVGLPRLKKRKVKAPKRICKRPEEFVCPPRIDKLVKYKLKKKPLKTLVLSEKHNEVSIAEFNRKKRRYHTQCSRITSDLPFGVYCGKLNIRRYTKGKQFTSHEGKCSANGFSTFQAASLLKHRDREKVRSYSNCAPESRKATAIFKKLNDKFGCLNIYGKQKTRSPPIQAKDYFKVLEADMLNARNRYKNSKEKVTVDEVKVDTEGVYRIITDIGERNSDIRPIIKKYFPNVQFSSNPCKTCECCQKKKRKKTMWEKICDYFRARPNCPAPGEWKKKKLREEAERAAAKAGLKVCGPRCKCIPKRPLCGEKILPKVITHKNMKCKPKTITHKNMKCRPKPINITHKNMKCKPRPIKKTQKKQCKQFRIENCPARVRTTCEPPPPIKEKCQTIQPPYPSFTERHKPSSSAQRIEECEEAAKRQHEVRQLAEACCKKQPRRSFSTLGVSRRRHLGQQCRHLSSRTKYDDDPYDFFKPQNDDNFQDMSEKELYRRILNTVKNRLEVLSKYNKEGKLYSFPCNETYNEVENNSMNSIFNNKRKLPISCTGNSSIGESGFLLPGDSIIKLNKPCDFLEDIQKSVGFSNGLDTEELETKKKESVMEQLDQLLKNQ